MEWKSNLFIQNVRGILRFEKRWSRPRFSLARGNEITLIQRFRAARLFPSAAPRSMDRGFSAGFPFLAGRRRGESLVPAGSLSFTFHAGREPRGRKRPAASHGCTTKLARRVPVLSSSSLPVCVGRFHDSLPGANLSILFRPWSLERALIDRMQRDASITSCPSFETASDFEGIQRFERKGHIEIEIDRVT